MKNFILNVLGGLGIPELIILLIMIAIPVAIIWLIVWIIRNNKK
jgi:hypothetical protein